MKKQLFSAIGVFVLVSALFVPSTMAAGRDNKLKRAIKKAMPVFKRVCGAIVITSGLVVTAGVGCCLYMGIIEAFPNEILTMSGGKARLKTN